MFEGDANQNVFGTKSLDYTGGNDPNDKKNHGRLRDRLKEADTERRKAREEAEARERAAEIAREERLKKIAYMKEMPDTTPAGTGMLIYTLFSFNLLCRLLTFCLCPIS